MVVDVNSNIKNVATSLLAIRCLALSLGLVGLCFPFGLPATTLESDQPSLSEQSTVPYYRIWRGWKKRGVEDFHKILAEQFIPAIPAAFAYKGLRSYLVAIPKEGSPSWLPDEIALISFESATAYKQTQIAEEEKENSSAYWNLFDEETSNSLVPHNFKQLGSKALVEFDQAYDVMSGPVDWQRGFSTFYIGVRKTRVSHQQFLKKNKYFMEQTREAFGTKGLVGYLVVISDKYKIAIQNWQSQAAYREAISSERGLQISANAASIMTTSMFTVVGATDFDSTLYYSDFVNVKFERPNTLELSGAPKSKRALFVVSSYSNMDRGDKSAGYNVQEVANSYRDFEEAGFTVDFASPRGGKAPIDKVSLGRLDQLTANFMNSHVFQKLAQTSPIEDISAEKYDVVIYMGGYGAMFDFPNNYSMQKLTAAIYERGGYVGAISQGSAALLNVRLSSGAFLVTGKQVAGPSNREKDTIDQAPYVSFSLEDKLKARGGSYSSAPDWQTHVLKSGRLVTGQNPASARGVTKEIIASINN